MVTTRSALPPPTSVVVVELLLVRFESVEVVVADAVLVIVIPLAVLALTFTTISNVADAPAAKVPIVPCAILYDLGIGKANVRPGREMGEAGLEEFLESKTFAEVVSGASG